VPQVCPEIDAITAYLSRNNPKGKISFFGVALEFDQENSVI